MKCRNCDELGHMSKECSKPKDWSRVKCSNCEQMGYVFLAYRCLRLAYTDSLLKQAWRKEMPRANQGARGGCGWRWRLVGATIWRFQRIAYSLSTL